MGSRQATVQCPTCRGWVIATVLSATTARVPRHGPRGDYCRGGKAIVTIELVTLRVRKSKSLRQAGAS